MSLIDLDEVFQHNMENDCWIVISGEVHNLRTFVILDILLPVGLHGTIVGKQAREITSVCTKGDF